MNDLFGSFGLLDWKPWITQLLLPPVPLIVMLVLAWWWQRRRPGLATALTLLALPLLWFSGTHAAGQLLEQGLLAAPSLSTARVAELRRAQPDGRTAVVILGHGVRPLAPEFGESQLSAASLERLHYGLWLARQLQAPVLFSGGIDRSRSDGASEAATAARIASRDFGRSLRWVEEESRDTRGNAQRSLPLLARDGVTQILLVTHGPHMRRALRAFQQAAAELGRPLVIVPAPMGLVVDRQLPALRRWFPSGDGHQRVRDALKEWIGFAAGA